MLQPLKKFDIRITNNCKSCGLRFRNTGNGLWLIVLIPLVLLCGTLNLHKVSKTYKTISIIGIGQLISSICNVYHYALRDSSNIVPFVEIGYIFSSTVVSLLLVLFIEHGVVYSLCVAVGQSLACHTVFEKVVRLAPKSFSYGEAAIASQSLILYLTAFFSTSISNPKRLRNCDATVSYILQAGFFTVFCVLLVAYRFQKYIHNSWIFVLVLGSFFSVFVIAVPFILLKINSLVWLFDLIVNDYVSFALIIYWVLCCVFSVYCLSKQVAEQNSATTTTRKNFHFAILFVLVPGLILRPCLMYLASGVGFALLVMLEACRKLQITHYSKVLQTCFEAFRDEKDEGELALTPLYLMVGCAAPLWIYPISFSNYVPLPVLSGVLSVAVGDTAASIFGSKFGEHKWPGTQKTVEGTLGCILSQIFVLVIFSVFGIIRSFTWYSLCTCSLVIFIVSLTEAKTDQIDNLVLPLISYVLFILFQ